MDSKQILDSLTSHIALYHSTSPSSSDRNPNPRKSILRWFSTLSVHQRQSFLTVVDPHFVEILLQMKSRLHTSGHGFFFILPDIPSSTNPSLPTLCFRRSRGLLARSSASNEHEKAISGAVRMFGSLEGVKVGECECLLDSFTVSEDFVKDVERFAAVMDGVSGGGFLRGEVNGLGVPWGELPWLKDKGYYSLESFVANRLEFALRLSWMNCNGGKKQRWVKSKEKSGAAGVATNVFWRKKGCMEWFLGLDPGIRKKMCTTFLNKGAKSLAKEIAKSPNGSLMDGMLFFKTESGNSQRNNSIAFCQIGSQLSCRSNPDFALRLTPELFSERNSIFLNLLNELSVLQRITTMVSACQDNELDTEVVFFSKLGSVQTISDNILRRLRGFIMVVSSDCVEIELMGDMNVDTTMQKTEEKLAAGCRKGKNKSRNSKKVNSTQKLSRDGLALQEPHKVHGCENLCRDPNSTEYVDDHILRSCTQMKELTTSKANEMMKPEHSADLVDDKIHIPRKRSGRKGSKSKISSLKETKAGDSQIDTNGKSVCQSTAVKSVAIESDATSSVSNDVAIGINPLPKSSSSASGEPYIKSDNEIVKDNPLVFSSHSTPCSLSTTEERCQSSDKQVDNTLKHVVSCTEMDEGVLEKRSVSTSVLRKSTGCVRAPVKEDLGDADSVVTAPVTSVCNCDRYSGNDDSSRSVTDIALLPSPAKQSGETVNGNNLLRKENSGCHPHNQIGSMSYEWPNLAPLNFSPFNSNNLPAATDRLHLDVGQNWPNHFHQSFFSARHQVRNAPTECGCGRIVPSLISPVSLDWPPTVRSCSRLSQSGTLNYDSVYNSRLQSSLCTGITNHGLQFKGTCSDSEWRYSGDVVDISDFQNSSDLMDDTESHWMSEEESDTHTVNGRDYSKYFGGGVMYWNSSDHVGTGFSRPPSHSSEDSSWAWHEADLNRAIDDMVGMPGLPASYSTNGLASPPPAPFCSSFDTLGPGQQSLGYVISGNDVNGKALDSQSSAANLSEEKIPSSPGTSTGGVEGMKVDSLPYPILRPIIIPSVSRKGSRSEFRQNLDHRSPCFPSRRDPPRVKRPPSPVVLCVPRAPRVPPPSPVGESRKQRGFPVVRSGSSSPRHWGMRNWYNEEINSEDSHLCMDGPEVVWASWGNKGLSGNTVMQPIPGSLLQDRLIAISQLARDQEHPDVAFPVQPPELVNCSSRKTSLAVMHIILHEEINSFCKQVAAENHIKKPYINWAVKRVARSLQVLWPRSRTNIFGSNATGLALPTSDVDLVVSLPPVRNLEPIKEAGILEGRNGIKETCLQHAARYLANQEWVKSDSLKTIENTAIPLIMLVTEVPVDVIASSGNTSISQALDVSTNRPDEPSNICPTGSCNLENSSAPNCSKRIKDGDADVKSIRLDISFKSPSHTGLQTTGLVRELTEQFPASVPLALILKQFLADRSLDHSYSGGLSSYCLVLLITRFLQHEHHLGRPLNQNLGSLLMDFLYFFGNVFDPRQMRVSIQGSGIYMSRERGHSIDPIHIDDPLCPTNNVGKNCFRIHQCIKAFADAYAALESELTCFSGDCDPSTSISVKLLPKIISSIDRWGQS